MSESDAIDECVVGWDSWSSGWDGLARSIHALFLRTTVARGACVCERERDREYEDIAREREREREKDS